jgi:hypothetical protein
MSKFVYIPLICKTCMYTLFNTTRCVNTGGYINLGLHRGTTHIHIFPMSHKLSKSVNILQRHNNANLTHMCGYVDVITVWYIHPLIGLGLN